MVSQRVAKTPSDITPWSWADPLSVSLVRWKDNTDGVTSDRYSFPQWIPMRHVRVGPQLRTGMVGLEVSERFRAVAEILTKPLGDFQANRFFSFPAMLDTKAVALLVEASLYRDPLSPAFKDWFRKVVTLALVPQTLVLRHWHNHLKSRQPATGDIRLDCALDDFGLCLGSQWICSPTLDQWNYHSDQDNLRTTNRAEGWHSFLRHKFKTQLLMPLVKFLAEFQRSIHPQNQVRNLNVLFTVLATCNHEPLPLTKEQLILLKRAQDLMPQISPRSTNSTISLGIPNGVPVPKPIGDLLGP
ncbi:hypothetical protein HPB47_003802 [Ixodes persulcatus]|uniref:Uncharacterized protein n=1 Tax=Ixodes persulcatus TaxID=34615 RepID=A0AC60PHJ5_IXOPE|nr:hypothetical protein HPB47_003802 [Ixodes persulcatus]